MVEQEIALLRERGHEVDVVEFDNAGIAGVVGQIRAATRATYSWSARAEVRERLQRFHADVMHAHNIFPLASPAVYDAAHDVGVPVVQTVHNYRMGCVSGSAFRSGRPCTACVGTTTLPGVWSRCYRGSLLGSAAAAISLEYHRRVGTWRNKVDCFIAPSRHVARWLVGLGISESQVRVKHNFVREPPDCSIGEPGERAILFAGRLAREKGVETVLEAWKRDSDRLPPLWIAGDGPMRADVERAAGPRICYLGKLRRDALGERMSQSACVLVPSLVEESFGLVAVEAMARGVPVVAARSGALGEVVGDAGVLIAPGDVSGLIAAVHEVMGSRRKLGELARIRYVARFSPDAVYPSSLRIYRELLGLHGVTREAS